MLHPQVGPQENLPSCPQASLRTIVGLGEVLDIDVISRLYFNLMLRS